jgi:hypothetical protein
MGFINFSIPKDLVIKIQNKLHFDNFIETGTWEGGTCFWAAKYFSNIYTIEINEEISLATSLKEECPKNIKFLVGDSGEVLPKLIPLLEGRNFFWLDGHWCGGISGGEENPCPLLIELESISKLKDSVIFIDDARCFLAPLPPPNNPEKWPLIDDIFLVLKNYFPNSFTTIIDDVIVCVPKDVKEIVFDYWIETFEERYAKDSSVPVNSKINYKVRIKQGMIKIISKLKYRA